MPKDVIARPLHRLGFRLIVSMGLALLPLAVLSFVQAQQVEREARARAQTALFGETLMAGASLTESIQRARGIAAAVALAVPELRQNPTACLALMQHVVATESSLSFAGFIPTDGHMTCSSTGVPRSFADNPARLDLIANPRPVMTVNLKGPISGESVLIFSHPVTGSNGALLGFVSLSMPHRALAPAMEWVGEAGGGTVPDGLVTFGADGIPLTAMLGLETVSERLPVSHSLQSLAVSGPVTFIDRIPNGEQRTFAVVPIADGSLYVLSSWRMPRGPYFVTGTLPPWVLPLAMWLVSLIVAWLATEIHALRHVRSLRRSIIDFAAGNRSLVPPDFTNAPAELRDVRDAYDQMVSAITHHEKALEDSIHQKEVLLREVHHRVKNNLQLIASIMSIQTRKATSDESKVLLKGLHDRVMSLATVHRELYQTTGLADVRADELLSRIVAQLERLAAEPGSAVGVKMSLDPIRLVPDQAVPLALMLAEAVTNVFKHSGRNADDQIELVVSLKAGPKGWARFVVENPLSSEAAAGQVEYVPSGLGGQLLQAFATQLSGRLETAEVDGRYRLSLDFPVSALHEAEERSSSNDGAAAAS